MYIEVEIWTLLAHRGDRHLQEWPDREVSGMLHHLIVENLRFSQQNIFINHTKNRDTLSPRQNFQDEIYCVYSQIIKKETHEFLGRKKWRNPGIPRNPVFYYFRLDL